MSSNIEQEIEELGKLPDGWHYGIGCASKRDVMDFALSIANICKSKNVCIEVNPEIKGGIHLTICKKGDDYFVCVTIDENLTIDYVIEKGKGSNYNILDEGENINVEKIILEIDKIPLTLHELRRLKISKIL